MISNITNKDQLARVERNDLMREALIATADIMFAKQNGGGHAGH